MNPILRNILAVLAGCVVGFIVNMGLIMLSPMVIAPPAGVDPSNMESISANMHLYEIKHFIMPFLAHALGTLAGAFTAAKLGVSNKMILAFVIGGFFIVGGIMAVRMLPAPMWFNILDLVMAYFPMAWLGGILAGANRRVN